MSKNFSSFFSFHTSIDIMSRTYSVRVTQRSLGIGFITMDREIVISEVVYKSKGYQLGLAMGDTLLSINDIALKDMDTYYIHKLPFKATFRTNPDRDINSNNSTKMARLTLSNHYSHSHSMSKSMSFSVDDFNNSDLPPLEQDQETIVTPPTRQLHKFHANSLEIGHYLSMYNPRNRRRVEVSFDTHHIYSDGHALCLMSSKNLRSGHHQWSLQIIKCQGHRQEIGIIGALGGGNNSNFKCNMNGLLFSSECGGTLYFEV